MTYLRVRNFSKLQHYTDRPDNPWIKFYVRTLDDEELNALPIPTRLLFDRLLLLAQRFGNAIPSEYERIAKLTCIEPEAVREGIAQLLQGAWLSETTTPRRASKRASKRASTRARIDQNRPETPLGVSGPSLRSDETNDAAPAGPNGPMPLIDRMKAFVHRGWDDYPDKNILRDELTDRGLDTALAEQMIAAEEHARANDGF